MGVDLTTAAATLAFKTLRDTDYVWKSLGYWLKGTGCNGFDYLGQRYARVKLKTEVRQKKGNIFEGDYVFCDGKKY
jgi:hypothetical protein